MPPKNKYEKEAILAAAFTIAKEYGIEAVTARDVAARLGTSSKPVYTAFANMEELKRAILKTAEAVFERYQERELKNTEYLPYKALGMAYVRFAKEEKELFKMLYMRDRHGEPKGSEQDPSYEKAIFAVEKQTGLDYDEAVIFHTEMWLYVHGIAVTLATSYLEWDFALISRTITDVYEGLKLRHSAEKGTGYEKHH